jgi:hyaluronan synthase
MIEGHRLAGRTGDSGLPSGVPLVRGEDPRPFVVLGGHLALMLAVVGAPLAWPEISFLYGPAIVASIVFRDIFATRYLRSSKNPITVRFSKEPVAIVVPVRNESIAVLDRVVEALTAQSHRDWEVFFVDDASESLDVHALLSRRAEADPRIQVLRLPERRGKRRAQAEAVQRTKARFIITLDSDTVLEKDALDHILQPFEEERVMAVMGNIAGLNRDSNVLTRMAASRARHGVLGFWAMQSYFGAILSTWGAFCAYRREVIADNLERYIGERFGGRPAETGDDRRLTSFALQRGRVVLAKNALARTLLPSGFPQWLRQQIRWSRNYLRYGLADAGRRGVHHPASWRTLPDIIAWLCIPGLCVGLIGAPMAALSYLVPYYGWLILSAMTNRDVQKPWRSPLWLVAGPLLTLASGSVRFLIRLMALATLGRAGWSTR